MERKVCVGNLLLTCGFLFNDPVSEGITKNLWKLVARDFHRLDALPITQPTVSKH